MSPFLWYLSQRLILSRNTTLKCPQRDGNYLRVHWISRRGLPCAGLKEHNNCQEALWIRVRSQNVVKSPDRGPEPTSCARYTRKLSWVGIPSLASGESRFKWSMMISTGHRHYKKGWRRGYAAPWNQHPGRKASISLSTPDRQGNKQRQKLGLCLFLVT